MIFANPNWPSSIKQHQNMRLWKGPAAITRERACLFRLFMASAENVTNAAGRKIVRETPAESKARDSLGFEHVKNGVGCRKVEISDIAAAMAWPNSWTTWEMKTPNKMIGRWLRGTVKPGIWAGGELHWTEHTLWIHTIGFTAADRLNELWVKVLASSIIILFRSVGPT